MTELATTENQEIVERFLASPEDEAAQMAFEALAQDIHQDAEQSCNEGVVGADQIVPALINQLKEIIRDSDILDANDEVKTQYYQGIDHRLDELARCSPTDEIEQSDRKHQAYSYMVYTALTHIIGSAEERAAVKALKEHCETYKTYLESKLKAAGVSLDFSLNESNASILSVEANNDNNPLLSKHDAICDLQSTLNTRIIPPRDRLISFYKKFTDNSISSIKRTISQHRDKMGMRFLKNVATFFASLLLGAGFIARAKHAKRQPGNSFSFWKSTGRRVADEIDRKLQRGPVAVMCRA